MLIQPLLRTTWPYIVNNLFTVLFPSFSDLIYQANHQMLSVTNLYSIFPAYHGATYHNVFGNQYSHVHCIHHPKAWHSGAAIVNFAFTVHWNWLVSWLVQSFTELSLSWMDSCSIVDFITITRGYPISKVQKWFYHIYFSVSTKYMIYRSTIFSPS